MDAREPARPATPHAEDAMEGVVGPQRRKLPAIRSGLTTKVTIGDQEGYITANADEDGTLREVFLHGWGKDGSTQMGLVQTIAVLFSIALQYEAEFPMLARKLHHMKFEPSGPTNDPEIPTCRSLPDYLVQWLALHFGTDELKAEMKALREREDAAGAALAG